MLHFSARAPPGKLDGEIGAGPVEHSHEIVADGADAGLAEIAQRLAEIAVEPVEIAATELDVVMHRHAFDDAPAQA
jgi:hypothetical protein